MSWLRPSRTVIDPRGATWEIYVTRSRLRSWQSVDTGLDPPLTGWQVDEVWWVLVPLLVLFEIVLGAIKLIALLPFGLVSAARHRDLRVEAIVEYPVRQVYAWDVERPELARVLDEISASLARGSIARPADARFLGEVE